MFSKGNGNTVSYQIVRLFSHKISLAKNIHLQNMILVHHSNQLPKEFWKNTYYYNTNQKILKGYEKKIHNSRKLTKIYLKTDL